MTKRAPPDIDCEQQHPSIAAGDVRAAVAFYTEKLGFKEGFMFGDPPTIAGISLGDVQMFIEKGEPNPKGCSLYFVVGNADELYEFHRAGGVEVVVPIADRHYGLRDYRVHDLNGYSVSFGHHLFNEGGDIDIERVDVPVRLEKRLAALLGDLAEHKHMTIASCLEETLLHTMDGVGPHTKGQLRYIEELKKKHGIDYDSHGSYRFRER